MRAIACELAGVWIEEKELGYLFKPCAFSDVGKDRAFI